MGYSISEEKSLAHWLAQLSKENSLLAYVMKAEIIGAALLLVVGAILFFTVGHTPTLWIGAILAILALGHWWKRYENDHTARHVARGREGEMRITHLLEDTTDDDAIIMNDITLRFGRQKAQIDHIVLARNGMFVIETKNWTGDLYGSENDTTWQQRKHDAKGKEIEVTLGNPIVQNARHCEVVRSMLQAKQCDWPDLFSVIIIARASTGIHVRSATPVIHPRDVGVCITQHPSSRTYDLAALRQAVDALLPGGWSAVTGAS